MDARLRILHSSVLCVKEPKHEHVDSRDHSVITAAVPDHIANNVLSKPCSRESQHPSVNGGFDARLSSENTMCDLSRPAYLGRDSPVDVAPGSNPRP